MRTMTRELPLCGCGTATDEQPDPTDREAVFRRFYPYIYKLARKQIEYAAPTDSSIGAEDLTQEAASCAARCLTDYDPTRGRFTTWLGQIVRRETWRMRSQTTALKRVRPADPETEGDEFLHSLPAPHVSAPDLTADFWARVRGLLTDREARVVEMRFRREMGFKDIGRVLGVTEQRVFQLCGEAIVKLYPERQRLLVAAGAA